MREVREMNSKCIVLAFCMVLCACDASRDTASRVEAKPWPTKVAIPQWNSSRRVSDQLSTAQVAQLKRQAWGGDPASAYLLHLYYVDLPSASREDSVTWLHIAAENGHGVAASNLASYFQRLGGEQNCLRAKFWYERAIERLADNPGAATAIKNMNLAELAESWEGCLERGAARNQ
jgi:hypothetical protein